MKSYTDYRDMMKDVRLDEDGKIIPDEEIIQKVEKDYPDVKVLFLEQNYRSTRIILEAADHVIAANQQRKEKTLWTENDVGAPLIVAQTYSEHEEAHFVVSELERLVTAGRWKAGDCAIMYRTNAQSRAKARASKTNRSNL